MTNAEQIAAAVHDAVQADVELLVIIGGDGTLQAAVTTLAEATTSRAAPKLLVLGGGRTNYVARDLGSHAHLPASLEKALDRPRELDQQRRFSLRVHQSGSAPQHGFFIGGALVDEVIRDCHRYRAGNGFWQRGHLSTPLRLGQLAALALIGRSRFEAPLMNVDAAPLGRLEGPIRLLLLTSLHHRDEVIDPYVDRGEGAIRLTAVAARAPAFWRRLYRLVRGRYHPAMIPDTGYLSGATESVRIDGLKGISLDGQEFDFDPNQPVEIRPGPEFEFLRP